VSRQLISPRPDANFSQAVRVGDVIHVAGQVAMNEQRELVGEGDAEAQARQCFSNLERVLSEAGASIADLVRVTVYLVGAEHYAGYAAAKRDYLSEALPAGTAVIVAGLMDPRFLIEIDAVAIASSVS
jgi:reactive intermediate/imine deaminase